jgi:hypothetical protein
MFILLVVATASAQSRDQKPAQQGSISSGNTVGRLVGVVRAKAKALEGSSGMRLGFLSFTSAHKLPAESIRYSEYVVVRLLFEATRDAGL